MKKPEAATPNYLLRTMRETYGWTQEELAEQIGTTCVTISRWESGVTFPNRYFRKKLSNLYGKSIQELGLIQPAPDPAPPAPQSIAAVDAVAARPGPIFLFNEALPAPGEHYGRRRERDTLISRTYRKASTSIVGPRRSGKTWLVQYLRYVAAHELGTRFSIKYLDATMPSCSTVAGFANEVLEEFDLASSHAPQGLIALEKGFKTLKTKNITPVLCIDEFEGFNNRQEFTLDFFRALRAMTQKFDLVLVTISRNPLNMVVARDIETSGFFNIFEPLMLEPFNEQEAAEFISAKGQQAHFTQQQLACMWKYAEEDKQKWPPLRLQLVGKMLLEDQEQPADDTLYWQKFTQRFENVYRGVMH